MNWKLYYFSERSLRFEVAPLAKTKITCVAISLFFIGSIVMGLLTGYSFTDLWRAPTLIEAENRTLKNQMQLLNARMFGFEEKILALSDRNNDLRSMLDLPKIDNRSIASGIGGTQRNFELQASGDYNNLMANLDDVIGKLEREVQIQEYSYKDVNERVNANEEKFKHFPALKPMDGVFNINGFGMRIHPIFRVRMVHEGLDISNSTGTPIYASADGLVTVAGRKNSGFGIEAIINHGFGFTTLYGHMSKVVVREGQNVKRGQLIGYCGSTGLSSGPHLHYEVWENGVKKNPIDYFFNDFDYKSYAETFVSDK